MLVTVVLALLSCLPVGDARGAEASTEVDAALRVAVREVPPFAMRDPDGNWVGISVELWEEIADRLDRDFAWVELTLEEELATSGGLRVHRALGHARLARDAVGPSARTQTVKPRNLEFFDTLRAAVNSSVEEDGKSLAETDARLITPHERLILHGYPFDHRVNSGPRNDHSK